MKSYSYLLFALVFTLINSCKYEEKAIFDLTPAERLNKAMSDSYTTLTSAPNGWEMAYFTNPEDAGYTLLVKFQKNGMAVIASQSELTLNKAYEQDSCLFEMIADYGPVLSFNTFNKVLHRFSNPENPDGYGLVGDYEFIVLKNTEQEVILQGKKHKSVIVLTKLSDNTNWKTHLQDFTTMDKLLFSANAPKLTMTVKNNVYSFTEGYNHVFLMRKVGLTTAIGVPHRVPFIVTKQGIRFQDKLEIEGFSFQNFSLNTENSALANVENPEYKLSGTDDLAPFAINNISVWNINPEKMSPNLKTAYNTLFEGFKTTYNADKLELSISYFITRFILTLSYSIGTTKTEGKIDLEIAQTAKDAISITKKTTSDTAGTQFLNEVAALNGFIALLTTNYTLTTVTKLNPTEIKFSKKTDTNQWFEISGK